MVIASNLPENINDYVCVKNEIKLMVPPCDSSTGEFQGIDLQLAYIILRGDEEEVFLSYRYNDEKSALLYSYAKDRIPNATISTCF